MEPIYYAIKVLAILWVFMIFFIFMFGGLRPEKDDRFSKYFIMITLSLVMPVIRATEVAGPRSPAALAWGFPYLSYAGIALTCLGIYIHLKAIFTLNKQWSMVVEPPADHRLVETGMYRFIRHPVYAGVLLELLGYGIALANWGALLGILLPNLVTFGYRIYVEEQALRRYFGDAYRAYARRTRLLIPGIL